MSPSRVAQPAAHTPRRLAYAPVPLADEPLDGYLEHIAHRIGSQPGDIHRHLGLTNLRPYSIVRILDAEQEQRISAATDISIQRLHAMTLARHAHLGLMPHFDKRGHGTGTWPRGAGARYCPDCLLERELRWCLSWYLQWTFVCTRHQRLLESRCPGCGSPVRSRPSGHPVAANGEVTPSEFGGAGCACTTNLLASHVREKAVDPRGMAPVLLAQEVIHGVIHGGATPVTAFGETRSRIEWMHDLASLTRLLMVHLPTDHIPTDYAHVLSAEHVSDKLGALAGWPSGLVSSVRGPRSTGRQATSDQGVPNTLQTWNVDLGLRSTASAGVRLMDATNSPPAIALTASAAAIVLMSPDVKVASELLSLLSDKARLTAVAQAARRRLSWPLIQALDVPNTSVRGRPARARLLRLQAARFRPDGTERAPLAPAKVPARIWGTLAASHPAHIHNGYAALAASTALLSLATKSGIASTCERLDHPHLASLIQKQLTAVIGLASDPNTEDGSALFEDLLQLHDVLTSGHVPIDYARRRRTFLEPVPPAERTARRIARELGLRPTPRLRRFMSWWIFELLTGSDVLLGAQHVHVHGAHRLAYARQRQEWETNPPPALLRRAERALLVNRLDEPLTWAPRRGREGEWTCPPPLLERQLDWSNRRGRQTSRGSGTGVDGLGIQDAVAHAASAQSAAAIRMAVKMARFAAVIEVGTITAAAHSIGLKQSVLSGSMSALERDLGITLIDRRGHGSTPTEAGRHLYRLVRSGPIRQIDPSTRMSGYGRAAAAPRGGRGTGPDQEESAS